MGAGGSGDTGAAVEVCDAGAGKTVAAATQPAGGSGTLMGSTRGNAAGLRPSPPTNARSDRPARRARPQTDESTYARLFGDADGTGTRPRSEASDDGDTNELNILPRRWRVGEGEELRVRRGRGSSDELSQAVDDDRSPGGEGGGRDDLNEEVDGRRSSRGRGRRKGGGGFEDEAEAEVRSADPLGLSVDPARGSRLGGEHDESRNIDQTEAGQAEGSVVSQETTMTPRELKDSLEKKFEEMLARRQAEGLTYDGRAVPTRSPRSSSPRPSPGKGRGRSASPRPSPPRSPRVAA